MPQKSRILRIKKVESRRNQEKKMARICFVFLVVAAAVLLVDCRPNRKCPKNEQWRECGTACEPSCKEPNPQECTTDCVIGCQCKQGYLRTEDGRCIKRNRC